MVINNQTYFFEFNDFRKFNILDIELEPNLYWTVKKTERRDKHAEDLTWFINKVYNDLTKDIMFDNIKTKIDILLKGYIKGGNNEY